MSTFHRHSGSNTLSYPNVGRDLLSTLPPELLLAIFEEHESIIPPASTPVCKSLLPYLRLNAYRHLHIPDDVTLAALGETLRSSPHLGSFVRHIDVVEEAKGTQEHTSWLIPSFIAAFDALPVVETITIRRCDLSELLDPRIMQTRAFSNSATTLILASPDPIPHPALRYLHMATSLVELRVATPMRYSSGPQSGAFAGNHSSIRKLAINAEPHASDFGDFFEYLSLEELELRSGTADMERIVESIGPSTRSTLRSLYFASTGFLSRRIDHALLAFPSLVDLTLWSIQFQFTPEFFATLAPLPLKSFTLLGPSDQYIREIRTFLESTERPATLVDLGLDMVVPSRSPSPIPDGESRTSHWRGGQDAQGLEVACKSCGVTLRGSIMEALRCMREA